jgi:CHAT domain-containing protein
VQPVAALDPQDFDRIVGTPLDKTLVRSVILGEEGALERLPRLPWAKREIDDLLRLLPNAQVLEGVDANESRLRMVIRSDRAEALDVVHVATHTLLDNEVPSRSALALSPPADAQHGVDGLVTNREIYLGWRLRVGLMTLSGCQTGVGRSAGLSEYLGLVHGTLRAGATCVVVSKWKVDDLATSLLMQRFYDNLLTRRQSKAAALRQAKLHLRDLQTASGKRPFAHPVYWAGFILIGDPH